MSKIPLVPLLMLALACADSAPPTGGAPAEQGESAGGDAPVADAPTTGSEETGPEAVARAIARPACAPDDGYATELVVSTEPLDCGGAHDAALHMIMWNGEPPVAFHWALGEGRGQGTVCVAPRPCDAEGDTLLVHPGEPTRIEWSIAIGDEEVEHGSAAVQPCDGPHPQCL